MMDFGLSGQCILRGRIRRFAREKLNSDVRERDRDRSSVVSYGSLALRWKRRGLPVPEAYGGAGLDPMSTAVALEALGWL